MPADAAATADVAATFCATLVDEWVRSGVTDAVVSPGSRSTPLAVALAADGRLRLQVHHDERSAAFLALGLGLASGRPAIVVTTSGTAAVELHPAVVEADHARVPLVACTADRPPELRDVGAPQTIDQQHLFGRSVRWFHDPGVPDAAAASSWRSIASRAVLASTGSPPGPVQLNLPFREPLLGAAGELPPGRSQGGAWHGRAPARRAPAAVDVDALAAGIAGRRGVLVAGGGIDRPEDVHRLAALLGWPVLADPRSGCRLPLAATISHADAVLRVPSVARRLAPEVVVRLGAPPSSKVLGRWLASLEAWQVGVDADGFWFDPDRDLQCLLAADPSSWCAAVVDQLGSADATARPPDGWLQDWAHVDAEAASALREVLARHPEPTEPAVARDVVAALPDGARLVVSSSMPVRDVEWYAAPRRGLRVYANRGANGIDGVVSTALGVALAEEVEPPSPAGGRGRRPTAVLVGDVAFLHDTNALVGAARRGADLTVVVVDNDGGGIFSFLPQAGALDDEVFERLFGTPHGADLIGLARAHGLPARELTGQAEVGPAVAEAAQRGGVSVLRVRTDRRANVAVHAELHEAVAAALAP